MKLNKPKEWFEARIPLEEGEVGAGSILESQYTSGSVKLTAVKCNEKPFSFSYDGRILHNGQVCLTYTSTCIFGGQPKEVPFSREVGEAIVNALNFAYKSGYEKDRVEWR